MYVSIEPDIKDAMDTLDGLYNNEKKVRGAILGQIGTKAKNRAKKDYHNVLRKRSGHLYSTIKRTLYRNKKAVVISAHNKEDEVRYGFVLAHGATIEAKKGEYLTFQIDGKWVKKKSITIPPKDFVEDPVKRYLKSPQLGMDVDKVVEKQIEKIEKKQRVSG